MENLEVEPEVLPESTFRDVELQPESVNTVFSIPELREKIIGQAIYNSHKKEPELCRKTIPFLRLMSKDWLSAVSKILRADKKPLFQLVVEKENSLNGTPYVERENGKLLDNFVNRVYTAPWNQERKPTFSLRIKDSFFRAETYNSLLSCLQKCGNDLLQLQIEVPVNGGSLTCIFPSFSLPSLQSLTVDLKESNIKAQLGDGEQLVAYSANITNLLGSLLNASSSLEEMTMPPYRSARFLEVSSLLLYPPP